MKQLFNNELKRLPAFERLDRILHVFGNSDFFETGKRQKQRQIGSIPVLDSQLLQTAQVFNAFQRDIAVCGKIQFFKALQRKHRRYIGKIPVSENIEPLKAGQVLDALE